MNNKKIAIFTALFIIVFMILAGFIAIAEKLPIAGKILTFVFTILLVLFVIIFFIFIVKRRK